LIHTEKSGNLPAARTHERVAVTDMIVHELPIESKTAFVLEEIFPRLPSPKLRFDDCAKKQQKTRSATTPPDSILKAKMTRSAVSGSQPLRQRGPIGRLLQFRQKMLDQFATLGVAFDTFMAELKTSELSRKEFQRFLNKHFLHLSKEELDGIFDFLDTDKNGHISLEEFERAIESHIPIRSLEDLRRKWIALGFTSMRQVVREMDPTREHSRRLTLAEFGPLLARVGVSEDFEHGIVFSAVSDDKQGTTTLNELTAALAAVSPSLLLEDIRDRLIKQFGSLKEAFAVIDIDKDIRIKRTEFLTYAVQHWKMSAYEAKKAFHLMDVDGNSSLTRSEFVSALALSEPSLHLEDIRKKVRQRYKSIREALVSTDDHSGDQEDRMAGTRKLEVPLLPELRRIQTDASTIPPSPSKSTTFALGSAANRDHSFGGSGALGASAGFLSSFQENRVDYQEKEQQTPEEFHALLAQVQFSETDTQLLFQMADIDGDGMLEPHEFNRAILLFAPCCVLEDLRLECLRTHTNVKDAFAAIPKERWDVVFDLDELKLMLEDLDLSTGVDIEAVHDVVESLREGGVTIGELTVALQASASGAAVPLTEEELNARATQQIHWQMAPFHRSAAELRHGLRQRFLENKARHHFEHKPDEAFKPLHIQHRRSKRRRGSLDKTKPSSANANGVGNSDTSKHSETDTKEEQDLQQRSRVVLADPQLKHSWLRVTHQLESGLESRDSAPLLDKIQGYYSNAGATMGKDAAVLFAKQSRLEHMRTANIHQAALTSSLVKRFTTQPWHVP